ncbi:hypothetical protein GIB67_018778 [Kingdonia uniflora]|uniref:3-hydroxyisobutyrate dehydrogenase-like NAD-binding domain-containing protein n=1 Tax=Kingdonia uniflora TaxID=39325 RepID=A0A7J7NE47_9MAGN|nr:hypothetical protein GIB67_018778 [Kingdonia uniflora]
MYIVTHIRASLSSFVVDEMEKEGEEVKEGFALVARKGCFGLPTACSSCLPVYLYLQFANVDFDLHFNLVHPDSAEINMSSSSLLQGERQGDNASRSSSSSSSSSGSGSSSSGDTVLYDMVSPFLDIMGKSRFYLGDVGNGTAMKLVVNMIMGSMMASFSERLLLSEKVGLDPKILVRSKITSFIGSPDSVMDLVSFTFDIMKLGNGEDIYSDIDFRVFCVIFTQGFVTKIFIGFE